MKKIVDAVQSNPALAYNTAIFITMDEGAVITIPDTCSRWTSSATAPARRCGLFDLFNFNQ